MVVFSTGTYQWRLELWETYLGLGSFKKAEQTITFYVKHTIRVFNNFSGGTVKIDGVTKSNGSNVLKITSENLQVGAIDQSAGGYDRVWNESGVYDSKWERMPSGGIYSTILGGTTRNFNYTVVSNDNGAFIRDILRKNYAISRSEQTEFDGTTSAGVIAHIVEQNSGNISAPSTKSVNGKSYYFSYWTDNNSTSNPRSVTPTDNTTYTAYYKAHLYTNSSTATTTNSQRKIVQSSSGDWAMFIQAPTRFGFRAQQTVQTGETK